ncbi:MAG: DUF362 domain-containing protein [Anaerolineae bacterium]|nr:DUF362 domain-containing protein [Anaerolineae bacterium]
MPIVSLIRCASYDEIKVGAALRRAVDLAGGMAQYVQPGQRVLLKVNLLRASTPEAMVTTHPAVVKALVGLVQEAGGTPVIGDSPGGPFVRPWVGAVYRSSGMTRVAEETGAELNWDFGETRLSHPKGHLIKSLEVGTYVTSADVVISVPKLKTHNFMHFTGATKNLFGVIPGTIKVGYHSKLLEREAFGEMLIDILTLIKPSLTVMDGIVGMDGSGPSAGDPFEVGALLVSPDGVALDVVAASLAGLDISRIYPLRAAIKRGLTTGNIADVDVVGDALADFHIEGFRAPEVGAVEGRGPVWLRRIVNRAFVPAPVANEKCVACGICARNCPVDAIEIVPMRANGASVKRAVMDLDKCIRCYCCHELCPERAIDLKKSWVGCLGIR